MVRESLGYTQKEMAKALDTNPQTWQVYEAGKSVPGGNVLEVLARLGFNVNWILTGIGQMKSEEACGWWAEKIKEIRGNMSIPEFVAKVKFRDPDTWIATIQAIEDSKIEADFGLMNVLQNELGISVDWMFGAYGVPKMLADRATGTINIDLLKDVIKEAELHESINPGSLSLDKKVELMARLYAMRAVKGK